MGVGVAKCLKKDGCGIPAPTNSSNLRPDEISLLLVPALAVDSSGIRLGYGGGYYDRLRSDPLWADVPAWVVLPSQCVQSSPLPRDSWDVPFQRLDYGTGAWSGVETQRIMSVI
jgi:5,10-methenyltetrahydrofolate synthetase